MPQQGTGARSKRRASAGQTAAQRAAASENLAKGRKKKIEQRKQAKASGAMTAKERWAMLLDGRLTVRDLDNQEISRMQVRGAGGGFDGKRRTYMPSHLAEQFHRESIRRANEMLRTAAPEAVKALLAIGTDPDVKEGDRIRALMYVVDRSLGKTPDVLRVEGESKFDGMLAEAIGLEREGIDASEE